MLQIEHAGTHQMGVLLESWVGTDTGIFVADWQAAGPQLAEAAQLLSGLAKLLMEQAQQQDEGSGHGNGAGQITRSQGSKSVPTLDPRHAWAGLSVPNAGLPGGDLRDWWEAGARNGLAVAFPGVPGAPLLGVALQESYRRWQQTDLTWFEGLFVPWLWPEKWRNRYLDLVDGGTDWANDLYKDHVREWPGVKQARNGMHVVNDAVEFVDLFVAPLDRAVGGTGVGMGWAMVKDTVNETTAIFDDPKGWWDHASGLDQAGVAASLIPAAGWAGKALVTTGKHAFKGVVNNPDLVRRLLDERGSVPIDFGFGPGRPRPGDYPEWVVYSKKPSSARPLPEDFEPGWAATKPGSERGLAYQEQVTGIERLPDGRVPEYIMRDPVTGHPVALDGHVEPSGSTPETFTDGKDGYTSLVTDPGQPWTDGMEATLLDEAKRQTRTIPDGAVLEWKVSDPESAAAIRDILDENGYSTIDVEYVPKKG